MITKGLWRHPHCLDIDFKVVDVLYRGPYWSVFNVLYIYRSTGNLVKLEPEKEMINIENFALWTKIG